MAEELLIDINIKGEESLPKLDENLDKVVKTGKKTTNAMAELRKEIKDAKADMLKYAEGTDQYNAAMKRAAAGADRMTDINGKLKASQRDVGVIAKNVAGSVSGLAAGFATASGVIALFGAENEELTKTMVKLQAVLNITQGLANFVDTFDNMKDLWGAIKMRISETTTAKNADTAATNANTAAIEANNAVNKSNVKGVNDQNKAVTELSDSTNNLGKESAVLGSNLSGIKSVNDKLDKSYKEVMGTMKINADGTVTYTKAIDQLTKKQDTFTGTIIKSISTMALYAAAIGGAIYVITKLIEWMNKVPEDLTIKIEIESDAINQTKSLREETLKFQSDYAKAQKNNDFQQLKGLNEIAKKQYGLSQTQINTINHTADGWKTFFKDYLKLAEDTYYNEALIKKKVDLQMQLDTAKNQLESIKESGKISEDQFKTLTKLARNKNVIAKVGSDIFSFGLEQDVLDATRAVDEIEKKLKDLDRLKPKKTSNYFTNISETKDIKETVTKKVEIDNKSYKNYKNYENFGQPDTSSLDEYYKNAADVISKNLDTNLTSMSTKELSVLEKQYNKGLLTTEEYLQEKYDLLKFAEDNGIDLTETAFNVQAQIVENAEQRKRDAIEKTIATIQASLDTSSMVTNALSELAQSEMDTINSKYDEKQNKAEQDYYKQVEIINKTTASEDEKAKLLEDLDKQKLDNEEKNEEERYKALKKNFELKKKLDIATAWINAASGIVSIWSHSTELGPIIGPIVAGIQSAAMLALTAAQTKSIMAQRMDAPVSTAAAKSSSSSASTNVTLNNAKLNPTQTSLISKEENINKMNQQTYSAGVVKVSDINKVQNTVVVRNKNASF